MKTPPNSSGALVTPSASAARSSGNRSYFGCVRRNDTRSISSTTRRGSMGFVR